MSKVYISKQRFSLKLLHTLDDWKTAENSSTASLSYFISPFTLLAVKCVDFPLIWAYLTYKSIPVIIFLSKIITINHYCAALFNAQNITLHFLIIVNKHLSYHKMTNPNKLGFPGLSIALTYIYLKLWLPTPACQMAQVRALAKPLGLAVVVIILRRNKCCETHRLVEPSSESKQLLDSSSLLMREERLSLIS